MKTLNQVLSYEHPAVVRRFQKDHPQKADRAEQLFKDLLTFFWASKKHQQDKEKNPQDEALKFVFIMDEEMKDIDHIWHVFLLYTQDYMEFCHEYFGEYLHHKPDVVPGFEKGSFDFVENLEKFLEYVDMNLGPATLERWFAVSLASA
jgi:hypothetical protein